MSRTRTEHEAARARVGAEAAPADGQDGRPALVVQWQGTAVCADLICQCGRAGHVDGFGAFAVRCAGCGAVFELDPVMRVRRVQAGESTPDSVLAAE